MFLGLLGLLQTLTMLAFVNTADRPPLARGPGDAARRLLVRAGRADEFAPDRAAHPDTPEEEIRK